MSGHTMIPPPQTAARTAHAQTPSAPEREPVARRENAGESPPGFLHSFGKVGCGATTAAPGVRELQSGAGSIGEGSAFSGRTGRWLQRQCACGPSSPKKR